MTEQQKFLRSARSYAAVSEFKDAKIIGRLLAMLEEERAKYLYRDHGLKDLDYEDVKASYLWNARRELYGDDDD